MLGQRISRRSFLSIAAMAAAATAMDWTLVPGSFKAGERTDCLSVGSDLSIPIPCAGYDGTQFGFNLDFYSNPYDLSGLYWKMDTGTLVVKDLVK